VPIGVLLNQEGIASLTAGSITIDGPAVVNMAVVASLSLTRQSSSIPNYIDEELAMPSAQGSNILRAVSDKGNGSPLVAVTSLSDTVQNIQVRCLGTC